MNMHSCALICSISRSADELSSCEVQIPNSSFKHIIAPAIHPPSSCHFNLVKVIMKMKLNYFPQIWKWKTRKPSLSSFKHIPYHTLNLKSCLFYLIKAMMNVKMINMKFHPATLTWIYLKALTDISLSFEVSSTGTSVVRSVIGLCWSW